MAEPAKNAATYEDLYRIRLSSGGTPNQFIGD